MDPVSNCQRAVDGAREMIAKVTPADLTRPTPCEEWDVRALIGHMTGTCNLFANALGARSAPGTAAPAGGRDDVAAAYTQASASLMREWRAPGALEKSVTLRAGPMPAALAAEIITSDQLIHTWDLAKSLGRPFTMPDDLATATLAMLERRYDPAQRGPGKGFDVRVEVPADAPLQEKVLAISGRRP